MREDLSFLQEGMGFLYERIRFAYERMSFLCQCMCLRSCSQPLLYHQSTRISCHVPPWMYGCMYHYHDT